jgi:hypothetical protein
MLVSARGIGLHELYTQFSLVSPLAMQHCVFVAVAQQMSISDERTSRRFRSSIVAYHLFCFHASAMEPSGRISGLISPCQHPLLFLLQPRSPVNFPTNQSLAQPSPVSQCRNSSISWALVSALLMKSPHHVDQHRKPQLHIPPQGMQVMDLVLEATFRLDIKTARNIAAKQTTKTTCRSPGATIQGNASTTTARKRRASELVKRNGIHKTQ